MTRRESVSLAGIALLGLLLRLAVIWACRDAGLFSDMQDYHDRALYFLQHGRLMPDAFRPPAYPLFIAANYALFGERLIAVRIAQALLGVVTIVLTYLIGRRLAGPRAASVAALIVAIYPAWMLYPVYLVAENLFTPLSLLGIWLWLSGRRWALLASGVVLATAILTRAVGIATVGGIMTGGLLGAIQRRATVAHGQLALNLTLLLIGCGIGLAPWILRNERMYGRFIPTDTASGYNFLLGNNPRATGRLELEDVQAVSEAFWGHAKDDADRSAMGFVAGIAFMKQEPATAARLAVRKIGYLVGLEGREHAWGYSQFYHGRRSPAVVWTWGMALLVSFPILMIAAAFGLCRPGLSQNPASTTIAATLVLAAAVHIASFGESRFHLPWVPLLAVMAGRVLSPETGSRRWSRTNRTILVVLLLGLGAVWVSQAPAFLERLALLASSPDPLRLPY